MINRKCFFIDPQKGFGRVLKKVLQAGKNLRERSMRRHCTFGRRETVASLVRFIDGFAFKPGYKRFPHSVGVTGIRRFSAAFDEVVSAGFVRAYWTSWKFSPIFADHGGKGQLSGRRCPHLTELGLLRPRSFRLPSREEELFVPASSLALRRHAYSLAIVGNIWAAMTLIDSRHIIITCWATKIDTPWNSVADQAIFLSVLN